MKVFYRFVCLTLVAGAISPAVAGDAGRSVSRNSSNIALAVPRPPAVQPALPVAGAFDALAPADRAVVERIFNNQSVTAQGASPLNLDQIAAAKRAGGWALVFHRLKANGLTRAKNVRTLVRRARHHSSRPAALPIAAGEHMTVVTTGSGHRLYFYRKAVSDTDGQGS